MGKVIKGNFSAVQKKKGSPASRKTMAAGYQIKISLLHSSPLIWRRIQVPGDLTLAELHEVIQLVMGWTDTHLHQFMMSGAFYGPAEEEDEWREERVLDEAGFTLSELEADMRRHCLYEYDFGDAWLHEIKVEEILPAEEKRSQPVLLAGERACPPENIGGVPGYEDFLSALANLEDGKHQEMLDWCGGDFDPDYFEPEEINKILKSWFTRA
jgi:Plasmid pRiA4b ORF-3-like protein